MLALVLLIHATVSAQRPAERSPFGPNVFVFGTHTPAAEMQKQIDTVYAGQ